MLHNTTNIPDQLIGAIIAFVMPPDTIDCVGSITVKNKHRGKIRGHWGYYYTSDHRVVVIVPRKITMRVSFVKRYSKRRITLSSRAEFLVQTMAHELRHAWQFKHWAESDFKWKLERTPMGKFAREVDAEIYGADCLLRWQSMFGDPMMREAADRQ